MGVVGVFHIRSGQVRVFNVHIQSKLFPGQEKKGVKGDRLYWRVQGSTSSPTGLGSRRLLSHSPHCP